MLQRVVPGVNGFLYVEYLQNLSLAKQLFANRASKIGCFVKKLTYESCFFHLWRIFLDDANSVIPLLILIAVAIPLRTMFK